MKTGTVRLLWLGLVLMMTFSMSACGDYSIQLPGNYALTRVYAGAVLINHPEKGVVVDANVDAYKVLNGLVIGHVTVAQESPEKEMSKPGYFIVNTKTHEVKEGLEKKAWLDALQAQGVSSEPSLGKPSRFDRDY